MFLGSPVFAGREKILAELAIFEGRRYAFIWQGPDCAGYAAASVTTINGGHGGKMTNKYTHAPPSTEDYQHPPVDAP